MNLDELEKEVDQLRANIVRATRGDDSKYLLGTATRGIWELALQVAELNRTLRAERRVD